MKGLKSRRQSVIIMVILDFLTAAAAWLIFWFYRQEILHQKLPNIYPDNHPFYPRDYVLVVLIPCFWLFIYYLSGTYFDLHRKSRIVEMFRGIISSLIGCLIIGLFVFSDDTGNFLYFFEITLWYLLTHLVLLLVFRFLWLFKIKRDISTGKVTFNTLIIGDNGKAGEAYEKINKSRLITGNRVIGYIGVDGKVPPETTPHLKELGNLKELEEVIKVHNIEEIVLAMASKEHKILKGLMIKLSYRPVILKIMPDLYDIIAGSVRINNVMAPVLMSIYPELLPDWQRVLKRVFDVGAALLALIILSPLLLLSAILVKLSSPGPVFYQQERIGLFGRPFNIMKFRSMFTDAEKGGPALSSDEDQRITKWGRIMRKWRIDELPQFLNILKGEMSLVGPRPERKFFIDQIVKTQPVYRYLHRVKPGLTSWGMVKFGYAENVKEMIQRMRFDLLYIENCSIALDLRIMVYTVLVILQGRGK